MKKKKGFIAVVVLFLVGAAAVVSLGLGSGQDKEVAEPVIYTPSIVVNTIRPSTGNLSRTGQFIGRVEPGQQVAVIPRTAGEDRAVHNNVGDRVEKGALLFEIDTVDIQLQVNIAEAAYISAKAQVDQSLDSGVDAQVLQLEAGYNQAKLAYESAVKLANMSEDLTDDQLDSFSDTSRSLRNAISDLDREIAAANANITSLNTTLEALYGSGVTDPPPDGSPTKSELLGQIADLESAVGTMQTSRSSLQANYISASSGYDQINDSRKLTRAQANAQIEQARVAMETAENALNLAREKSIPQGESTAQAGLNQAEASLTAARRQLEYARVTAPISGVIEMKNVEVYGFATSASPAYVISNKDMMVISFSVPENVLYNLSIGDAVTVERGGRTAVGEITELATMVNNTGGLFTVKASLPSGAMNLLTGTTVSIVLETARAEGAMLLPVDCIYYDNNVPYVYTVEDGKAKKMPVVTGLYDNDFIEILSGIGPRDDVVATWHSRLTDGAELSVKAG